jgi:hypothetical protein
MLEIGHSLLEERQRRRLTLVDVEAATLIRARYLDALEHEQFDLLPVGSYRRSFLRTYAAFLGLDGDVYAEEYDLRLARLEAQSPTLPVSRRSRLGGLLAEPALRRTVVVLAGLMLVALAVWQLGVGSGPRVVNAVPPAAHHRRAPRLAPRHPSRAPLVVRTRPPAVHPTRPHRRASLTLTAARGRCWLLVRIGSSAGRTVYEQTLEQGQSVRFGLRRLLWIRVGAPGDISAAINGHVIASPPLSGSGDLVATSTGLRAGP